MSLRRSLRIGLTFGALVMLAGGGCTDRVTGTGAVATVPVLWMEWPALVRTDTPGQIRVVGVHDICGTFHLQAVTSGASGVNIGAWMQYETSTPPPCAAVAVIFDTLIALPSLTTPAGAGSFTITAPYPDPLGGVVPRAYGAVELTTGQPDALTRVGGRAIVLDDSLGCSWATPQIGNEGPYVLSTNLTLGTNGWRGAFISGGFQPAFSPRCGQNILLQLQVVEVDGQ
jgi:hypothetical protein